MEKKKEIHIGFSDTEPTMTFSCPPEGLPQKKKKKKNDKLFLISFHKSASSIFLPQENNGWLVLPQSQDQLSSWSGSSEGKW